MTFQIGNKVNLGRKPSLETRKKIGLAGIGRPAWNKGKQMSEESCMKMSIAKRGKPSPNKGKKCSECNWKYYSIKFYL